MPEKTTIERVRALMATASQRAERLERLHAVNILRAAGALRDTRQSPEVLVARWRRLTDEERARLVASYREV